MVWTEKSMESMQTSLFLRRRGNKVWALWHVLPPTASFDDCFSPEAAAPWNQTIQAQKLKQWPVLCPVFFPNTHLYLKDLWRLCELMSTCYKQMQIMNLPEMSRIIFLVKTACLNAFLLPFQRYSSSDTHGDFVNWPSFPFCKVFFSPRSYAQCLRALGLALADSVSSHSCNI